MEVVWKSLVAVCGVEGLTDSGPASRLSALKELLKNFSVKRYTTKEEKYGDNKRSVRRTAEGLQQSG